MPNALLNHGTIRERMRSVKNAAIGAANGKSDDWARKVLDGDAGVLLDDIPRLLATLGMKAVEAHQGVRRSRRGQGLSSHRLAGHAGAGSLVRGRRMNRLSSCPRCGQDIILREGIRHGKPAWLEYDAECRKQHRLECKGRVTHKRRVVA